MDLTLEHPGDHLFIRSVSAEGIRVVDDYYSEPIILSPDHIISDWAVTDAAELTEAQLEPILQLKPEIVLIGTGPKQIFLPPELMMFFYSRNIGFEVMTTDAACRTFNVLASEGRKVVAALLPVS
jgi:uncharacterized protein